MRKFVLLLPLLIFLAFSGNLPGNFFAAGNKCFCGTTADSHKGHELTTTGKAATLGGVRPRIVGGSRAKDLAWMAYVGVRTVDYARKRRRLANLGTCGGSVISEKFVLSAAHCFVNDKFELKTTKQVFVVAGTHNIDARPGEKNRKAERCMSDQKSQDCFRTKVRLRQHSLQILHTQT